MIFSPNFNLWQKLFLDFQMYLQSNHILLDSFNIQMQFNCFQQFLMNNQNSLVFQSISKQNQVFQQFLIWRQWQQPQPQPILGILPRDNITETLKVGSGEFNTTFTMITNSGHKVVIKASSDTTFEELFKMYMKKIGLPLESIGKDVFFFINGAKIDPKTKESIDSMNLNFAQILVSDFKSNLGA